MVHQGIQDESYGSTFEFTAHANELIIAGVFIRIYNAQVCYSWMICACRSPLFLSPHTRFTTQDSC